MHGPRAGGAGGESERGEGVTEAGGCVSASKRSLAISHAASSENKKIFVQLSIQTNCRNFALDKAVGIRYYYTNIVKAMTGTSTAPFSCREPPVGARRLSGRRNITSRAFRPNGFGRSKRERSSRRYPGPHSAAFVVNKMPDALSGPVPGKKSGTAEKDFRTMNPFAS